LKIVIKGFLVPKGHLEYNLVSLLVFKYGSFYVNLKITIKLVNGAQMRLRLLERIRLSQGPRQDLNSSEVLTASLEKHLALILNTHQGSSASAPDFGLPDLASLTGESDLDTLRDMTRIISEVIRKYEPRLKNASVSQAPSRQTGVLEFTLSGTIELGEEKRKLVFSTAVHPDGQIVVY
jgi:type VI secretion system lysozyme-like protein